MERRIELPRVLSTFDEESLKLYSLVHYAGIMIDPSLFKNILDLLKAGMVWHYVNVIVNFIIRCSPGCYIKSIIRCVRAISFR